MLRDRNLVPLSHQHQHALALCVRLDRAMQAGSIDLEAWQSEIQQIFDNEISIHFTAEEKEVFPIAERFNEMKPVVQELRAEHATLRNLFARNAGRALTQSELQGFVEALSHHIRKEERQLFEGLQKVMTAAELTAMGAALDHALRNVTRACSLPKKN